jgi:hypothetical protein
MPADRLLLSLARQRLVLAERLVVVPGSGGGSDPLNDTDITGFWNWDTTALGSASERTPGGGFWDMTHSANAWTVLQVEALSRISRVADLTAPRGWTSAQFTVQPGDQIGSSSGERAEVTSAFDKTGTLFQVGGLTGHEFYALSVKAPVGWVNPMVSGHGWGIFLQLHGPTDSVWGLSGASPALALSLTSQFELNYAAGDYDDYSGLGSTIIQLSDSAINSGSWVQFVIEVTWAYNNTGSLTVYRRDVGESAFAVVADSDSIIATINTDYASYLGTWTGPGIPTLQHSSSAGNFGPHDWKCGLYRNINASLTSQLMLGPLVRGRTFAAVTAAAFG